MLTHLHIENIAVIENLDMDLSNGFIVLTGQTGAGKTILLNSIQMILGQRVSRDIIRSGCEKALCQAVFSFEGKDSGLSLICEELGVDFEDEIIVQREFSIDDKSKAIINGRQVTLAMLKKIGDRLVNIHGQHDNHALLDSKSHIVYLDKYAKNAKQTDEYSQVFNEVCFVKTELNKLSVDEQSKQNKIELLTYQVSEIEHAELEDGEEEQLQQLKKELSHAEKIEESLEAAWQYFKNSENNALDFLRMGKKELSDISEYNEELNDLYERCENLYEEFDSLSEEISDFKGNFEYNGEELDNIEERLNLISKLKRKYGKDIREILDYLKEAQSELESITFSEKRKEELTTKLLILNDKLTEKGYELTKSRQSAAKELQKSIIEELSFLEMPKVQFVANINACEPCQTGMDEVEFLLSTNIGEDLRPLAKIASGGELSRIMLSIKNVLADCDTVQTLIFDEIDTGVSGSAAQKIAKKMKQMSKKRQVISVTHLAQIAAYGDEHFLIDKTIDKSRTYTTITLLNKNDRASEIAKMMSGTNFSETMLLSAKQMLENATDN